MKQVLVIREIVVKFFKRYEAFILPVLKFLLGWFVFSRITSIGYMHGSLEELMPEFPASVINLLFALLFTIMPMSMSWILIILTITVQYSANIDVALAVFLFLMLVFLFYARMAPRESILILFTILAFHFNVPYLLPLLVGLYFPVTAIIPVTLGIFINAQIPIIDRLSSPAGATLIDPDADFVDMIMELPDAFSELYSTVMVNLTAIDTWIYTTVIFALVTILVHIVSRQAIDYAREIAIGLGSIMIIFGFVVSAMMDGEGPSIGMVILGTLLCAVIALLVQFFDAVLDYQRAESVQFQDDDNYYHVRIVPKVIMTKPQRVVKRIRAEEPPPEDYNDDED